MSSNSHELNKGAAGQAFLHLINMLTLHQFNINNGGSLYPVDYAPKLNQVKVFDFIIVGGGTAGCALASRLTENPDWDILLIEAGTNPSSTSEIPAYFETLENSDEDWNFFTEPEERLCHGMIDHKCHISRGKALGGTSTINNMHYERGYRHDFLNWAPVPYNEAEIHYKHIENFIGSYNYLNLGTDGDITIDSFNKEHIVKDMILDAVENFDYRKIVLPYQNLGYYDNPGNVKHGERYNFAKAFLTKAKDRENLFLAENMQVVKIIADDPNDRRIKGVEAMYKGQKMILRSKAEVILTAGAINSAHLLMLSGFGPAEMLDEYHINLLANLDVGKNLQDHVGVPMFVQMDSNFFDQKDTVSNEATFNFLTDRKGASTQINIHDFVGSINTKKEPFSFPNIKVYHRFFGKNDRTLETFLVSKGYVDRIHYSIINVNKEKEILVFTPTLIKPLSRGEVTLCSSSPLEPPCIKGNYLQDEENADYENLWSGMQYIMKLIERSPFAAVNASLIDVYMPNCLNYKYCTDAYLKCYLTNMGHPMSQIVGTAKSGNYLDDCQMVTNHEFLVEGIRHLRVVDGSVIPESLSSNIQATVAMLADKVAEDIVKKWGALKANQ